MARLAVLFLLGLAGCVAPQTRAVIAEPGDLSPRAEVAKVPFFPQEKYYCGPAALTMVLAWSGLQVTQDEVARQVYTPGAEGTFRTDVLAAARRHGRLTVPVGDLHDLLAEIEAGHPVLVFQNLALDWFPQWHFAVVIGYDLAARQIILHSGLEERLAMSLDSFEWTWKRGDSWALVVLPPDLLPATASESELLRAAAGLERARRWEAAAAAYAAMAARWPGRWLAHMGLGNARYALGEFAAAERAYRAAIASAPDAAASWNNLAYALSKQGRHSEAIAAARRAIELGGDDGGAYRDTLKEISGGAS